MLFSESAFALTHDRRMQVARPLQKYPYIHGYLVASFPHLTEPVQHTLQCGPALRYSVDLRTRTYTVSLKYGKLATKYPWIYGHHFTVHGAWWTSGANWARRRNGHTACFVCFIRDRGLTMQCMDRSLSLGHPQLVL